MLNQEFRCKLFRSTDRASVESRSKAFRSSALRLRSTTMRSKIRADAANCCVSITASTSFRLLRGEFAELLYVASAKSCASRDRRAVRSFSLLDWPNCGKAGLAKSRIAATTKRLLVTIGPPEFRILPGGRHLDDSCSRVLCQ